MLAYTFQPERGTGYPSFDLKKKVRMQGVHDDVQRTNSIQGKTYHLNL
jgi:hypothetical protein